MPAAVHDNPARSRFELDADGATAVANYRIAGNVITFTHTEVPEHERGHGVASQLIDGALQAVRARKLKVVAHCSFVRDFLDKHPKFHDLLA
jgi:uncharacterized protein